MKARLATMFSALILAAAMANAEPVEPATLEQDIRSLLHLTMPDSLLKQMMAQMIEPFRQAKTGVPNEFWERFLQKVDATELIELIVPIYKRHFTHQDIKELTAFFESPVGQKFLGKQAIVMQESMAVGQLWGESLGKQVQAELKAAGLE